MRMILIPGWIPNILFFLTCVLAGYQHSRLKRDNPVTNLQFIMMVFSLLMIVAAVIYNRFHTNPWVSLAFFILSAGSLLVIIRQQRMLPPKKSFE